MASTSHLQCDRGVRIPPVFTIGLPTELRSDCCNNAE